MTGQELHNSIQPHTVEPNNITKKEPHAFITAPNESGVSKNFDSVRYITIDTASLITDSP